MRVLAPFGTTISGSAPDFVPLDGDGVPCAWPPQTHPAFALLPEALNLSPVYPRCTLQTATAQNPLYLFASLPYDRQFPNATQAEYRHG